MNRSSRSRRRGRKEKIWRGSRRSTSITSTSSSRVGEGGGAEGRCVGAGAEGGKVWEQGQEQEGEVWEQGQEQEGEVWNQEREGVKVWEQKEERAIRGLCCCKTCKHFVSQDGNGARNIILRVYRSMVRGEGRSHELRFGQPRQVMRTLYQSPTF
ncbi:hypothetical protein VYU27_002400 [Nannochloropsis oceanica]